MKMSVGIGLILAVLFLTSLAYAMPMQGNCIISALNNGVEKNVGYSSITKESCLDVVKKIKADKNNSSVRFYFNPLQSRASTASTNSVLVTSLDLGSLLPGDVRGFVLP